MEESISFLQIRCVWTVFCLLYTSLEQICKMVEAYLASGMNYFDTAYMYCGGKSESIVKKALVERHPRESFTLTTKLPQWMMDEGRCV